MDANGILNVSAKDNSTGKSETITIRNDKGRLSKEEIERMVNEAEKYQAEDEKQREKIASRNALEGYVFGVKGALDLAPNDKLTSEEKDKALGLCTDIIKWLDNNLLAEKEEFEFKMKESKKNLQPFMMKLHGSPSSSQNQQHPGSGPTVEEMD